MRSRAVGTYRPELVERRWWPVALVLAIASYAPLLLTSRGARIADRTLPTTDDPGGLLVRSLEIWDPQQGFGGIAEDRLTHLWPAGPYLWVTDALRLPPWVAERLWAGSILFLAGAGVLYLCHTWRWRVTAATAAAFTYAGTPYIALLADRSALVLPLAGLPWLLGLTVEAMRRRGWRHPAAIALVLASIAPAGILSVLAVALVPALWAFYAVVITGEVRRPRAITTLAKVAALAVPVNLWWLVALSVRWTNGLDVADASNGLAVLHATGSAPEVLRGLGHWLLYDRDAGSSVRGYTQDLWLLGLTFVVPTVALLALGVSRWRYRTFAIGLVVVGLVLTAGLHPSGGGSPAGRVAAAVLEALTPVVPGQLATTVPVVALGVALGLGSLVAAAAEQAPARAIGGVVAVVLVAGLSVPPLWGPAFTDGRAPRQDVPAALVDRLEREDARTRVLELTTGSVDRGDALPLLEDRIDRPYAARTIAAAGSAPAADLLAALDTRVRQGSLDGAGLVRVAGLLGVGDIVVRGPVGQLAGADALGPVESFGDTLAVLPVADPEPMVRARDTDGIVLLSGNGMGIVDAADAGVLRGDEVIRYSAELTADPEFLVTHLRDERHLVVTDTNRARGKRWTALRDVDGFTETVDGGLLRDDPADARLSLPGDRPEARTVVEQRGLSVQATSYGPDRTYRTDRRPAAAVDGDPSTAWTVDSPESNRGERLELRAERAIRTDELTILQAGDEATTATITAVDLLFDGRDRLRVELDAASRQAPGQIVEIGDRSFASLTVEIAEEARRPVDGVTVRSGLAEVDIGGQTVREIVRMPSDLLDAAGFRSSRYPLSLVMTRIRSADDRTGRTDEEVRIARAVTLPTQRTFEVRGTARLGPDGAAPSHPPGTCRDDLVAVDGAPVPVRLTAGDNGEVVSLEGCEPLPLRGGERVITTAPGAATGVEVDQLVLRSAPRTGAVDGPLPDSPAPRLSVDRTSDTRMTVRTDGAPAGEPFWLVVGESFDEGWSVIESEGDDEFEVDGPHLVDGFANGFLITPGTADPVLTVRYLPQNRLDVGLLVSAAAVVFAVVLLLAPAPQLAPASIPLQEPLRRLRAFTYEGALPGRQTAWKVGGLGLVLGLLFASPVAAVALGAIGMLTTRRETWRPLLTVLPAVLVAGVGLHVVLLQADERIPAGPWWPGLTDRAEVLAVSAVLLLVLDAVIEYVWRRNSHLR